MKKIAIMFTAITSFSSYIAMADTATCNVIKDRITQFKSEQHNILLTAFTTFVENKPAAFEEERGFGVAYRVEPARNVIRTNIYQTATEYNKLNSSIKELNNLYNELCK